MTDERKELVLRILLPGFLAMGLVSAVVFLSVPRLKLGLPLAFVILGITSSLVFFMARYSLLLRRSRDRLDVIFRESERKYQAFVDAASDGFLFLGENEPLSADQTVLDLTGYTETEIKKLNIRDLVSPERDGEELFGYLDRKDPEITGLYEIRLIQKNGEPREAVISASAISSQRMKGFVLIIKDMADEKDSQALRLNVAKETQLEDFQTSLLYLNQPVREITKLPLICDSREPLLSAIDMMTKNHVNSIIIRDTDRGLGILTDQDLRNRVLVPGLALSEPSGRAASYPLITIQEDCLFFEAFYQMRDRKIRQVGVENSLGELTGFLSEKMLMQIQGNSPYPLLEELKRAKNLQELADGYRRLPGSLQTMIKIGADAQPLCRVVTRVSQMIINQIITKALAELGPAPCRFAFLSLGSEGRGEQTLLTDQDNAILYEDVHLGKRMEAQDYFLKLGEMICTNLDTVGYRLCKGGVMAQNPKWCRSLSSWQEAYQRWLYPPDDGAPTRPLLEVNILFDFDPVYGDKNLARELRVFMNREKDRAKEFFYSMAQTASRLMPPINFRGKIQVSLTEEDDEVFDIKKALSPLVIYARLYAMKKGLFQTNTLERLKALHQLGVFSEERYREIEHAFDYLVRLRFRDQIDSLELNEPMDNFIYMEDLIGIEKNTLEQIFQFIQKLQKEMHFEFTGSLR